MFESLKKQFPQGLAWLLPQGQTNKLIEALSIEPERVADFLRGIKREANPGTAVETQQEWYEQYGISYDPAQGINVKQAETLNRYISLGDQDIVYFQKLLDDGGFSTVIISETYPYQADIDEGDWSPTLCTIALNNTTSPDGNPDGALVTSLSSVLACAEVIITPDPTAGKRFKFSIWLKNISVASKEIELEIQSPSTFTSIFKIAEITDEWVEYVVQMDVAAGGLNNITLRFSGLNVGVGQQFYFWNGRLSTKDGAYSPLTDTFKFNLVGTLTSATEEAKLVALVQRVSPAHCYPFYNISISNNVYGVAICGVGICSDR